MFDETKTHPSYGMLQFNRISSSGNIPLFGSSIMHKDVIEMVVRTGEVDRTLSRDWYHGHEEMIRVQMSYSQFAEAITSMNMGTGVPVTIKRFNGEVMPDCPFEDKRKQFEDEFKNKNRQANEKVNGIIEQITNIMDNKKSLGKKDMNDIVEKLNMVYSEINSNTEFIYRQFNEQMDKTVRDAKGEIEAFMQNKINSIANAQLVEHRDEFAKLNGSVDI